MYHLSIAVFCFIVCTVSSLVLSSMAIHWAVDPIVIFRHPFPYEIAFGIGITATFGSLVLFVLLLFDSANTLYICAWVALIGCEVVTAVALTSPQSLSAWVDRWGAHWSNTSFPMSFQLERRCCGWENYTDRGIDICPFLFYDGCKELVSDWILVRYKQVFATELLMLVLYAYTVATILWAVYHDKKRCLWAEIEIPFLRSDIYDTT